MGSGPTSIVEAVDPRLTPLGYSKLTGLSTAKGLAGGTLGAIPDGSVYALITPEGNNVRWRDDGTDPVAGATDTGTPLLEYASWFYNGDLTAIKIIEDAATAVVHVVFYGR